MKHFVIKYWWVFLCLVAVSLYSCDNNNLTVLLAVSPIMYADTMNTNIPIS